MEQKDFAVKDIYLKIQVFTHNFHFFLVLLLIYQSFHLIGNMSLILCEAHAKFFPFTLKSALRHHDVEGKVKKKKIIRNS